jgi:hypothetical protein
MLERYSLIGTVAKRAALDAIMQENLRNRGHHRA